MVWGDMPCGAWQAEPPLTCNRSVWHEGRMHGVSRRHDAVATWGDTVEYGAIAVAQVLCGAR